MQTLKLTQNFPKDTIRYQDKNYLERAEKGVFTSFTPKNDYWTTTSKKEATTTIHILKFFNA